MRTLRETFQATPAAGLAVGFLALGMGIHAGLNQPRMDEIGALKARRANLLTQMAQFSVQDRRDEDLVRVYGRTGEASASMIHAADPLTYIGRTVESAGLTRVEMGTEASGISGELRLTRFSLHVQGNYGRILDFVRMLEQGPRITTIESLSIQPMLESSLLDGRFRLTVHDPAVNP